MEMEVSPACHDIVLGITQPGAPGIHLLPSRKQASFGGASAYLLICEQRKCTAAEKG